MYRKEPIWGKDKWVVDYQDVLDTPAVDDKRLIVLETEFGSVLLVMKRQGNNLNSVVRNIWDSGNLSVTTKVPRRATGAHVTILGHVTVPELKSLLLDVDCFNGFANRPLWAVARRSKRLPDGGRALDLSDFTRRIGAAVEMARGFRAVDRDGPASELWDELYLGELAREYPGILGQVTARAEPQVLRLSLVYALLDKSPVVKVEHIRAAMAVWRTAWRRPG